MKIKQITIAKAAKISSGHLSSIISGQRDPSLSVLRRLKQAAPWTTYELWIDGKPEERKDAIKQSITSDAQSASE